MSLNCGYVGLVGIPNVGKSSLLNNLISEKLAIVSAKPQTTRRAFTGIVSSPTMQLVFRDAPGYIEGKKGLGKFLMTEALGVLADVDHLLLVVAKDQKENVHWNTFWEHLEKSGKSFSLVVTRGDCPPSTFFRKFCEQFQWVSFGDGVSVTDDAPEGAETSSVMSRFLETKAVEKTLKFQLKNAAGRVINGFGVNNMRWEEKEVESFVSDLGKMMPEQGGYFYDPDISSPDNLREIVADWIREACFHQLEKELPFSSAVRINSFDDDEKILKIDATLLVEKENHKAIVIGKGGSKIKEIGQEARLRLEDYFGKKVFLGLHVSVKKWQDQHQIMKELGYVKKS